MRDPKRINEIIVSLYTYWINHPDLRLGQIIGNMHRGDPFFFGDDEALSTLNQWNDEDKLSMAPWGREPDMTNLLNNLFEQKICSCCGELVDYIDEMGYCRNCVDDGNCE